METSPQINPEKSFLPPFLSMEETNRANNFRNLHKALENSFNNHEYSEEITPYLIKIDSALKECCEYFITKEMKPDLIIGEKEFPSKSEIFSSYLNLLIRYSHEKNLNTEEAQVREVLNTAGDISRVIKRMVDKEPLYLIPQQVKTFKDFLNAFEDYRPDFPHYYR